jgi:hypothetical protein
VQAAPIIIFAGALGVWLFIQEPGPRPDHSTEGFSEQLARDLAIAHQDAVVYVQATGAVGSPISVTPIHSGQTIWWPVSCSDGTWVATYAGPSRDVDEGGLFRAVDDLLDGPLTVGVARGGSFVRHGTTIASLPCPIADGKTVLQTHS